MPVCVSVAVFVCAPNRSYTVTSREQYEEPVEILTLEWCMQIPPRCPRTRTELRQRWRMKVSPGRYWPTSSQVRVAFLRSGFQIRKIRRQTSAAAFLFFDESRASINHARNEKSLNYATAARSSEHREAYRLMGLVFSSTAALLHPSKGATPKFYASIRL